MKKLLYGLFAALFMFGSAYSMDGDLLSVDTSDPLYMLDQEHLLSTTKAEYGNEILRFGQAFAYGMNNRLMMHAGIHYQFDFKDTRGHRGFSGIELGGVYRSGLPDNNSAHMSTDVLFGGYFGGNRYVREDVLFDTRLCRRCRVNAADYARSSYFAGLRVGRQWAGVSLAGTVKSTWIFDDVRGMSFIDFTPEAYFRIIHGWRFGVGFVARVATDSVYDREWWKFKLAHQFGRTQYGATFSYEYENEETSVGAYMNLLF